MGIRRKIYFWPPTSRKTQLSTSCRDLPSCRLPQPKNESGHWECHSLPFSLIKPSNTLNNKVKTHEALDKNTAFTRCFRMFFSQVIQVFKYCSCFHVKFCGCGDSFPPATLQLMNVYYGPHGEVIVHFHKDIKSGLCFFPGCWQSMPKAVAFQRRACQRGYQKKSSRRI